MILGALLLLVMELTIGDKVFYTRSTGLRVPAKVLAILMKDMWSWSSIKMVFRCQSLMPHGLSFGIPSLYLSPPSPEVPSNFPSDWGHRSPLWGGGVRREVRVWGGGEEM